MPTPTTNIALSTVQTEFGGSNPISMSEYYRGSGTGYVPSGQATSGTDGTAISISGAIRFGMFRGLVKVVSTESFNMTFGSVSNSSTGTTATALFGIVTNGTCIRSNSFTTGTTGNGLWWSDSTPPVVHVKATVTSGSLTSGTINTWVSCGLGGSAFNWTRNRTSIGTTSCTITVDFSLNGGTTVNATRNITLTADYS